MAKYYDQDKKVYVDLTPEQAEYLAAVTALGGGPRYKPASGSVRVATEDGRGDIYVRDMDSDAYHEAKKRGVPIATINDSNEAKFAAAEQDAFERRADELAGANRSSFETFVDNAIPFARPLKRTEMTDEEAKRDIRRSVAQDQAHPVASGVGTVAQLIGTAAIPIKGLGTLAKGLNPVKTSATVGMKAAQAAKAPTSALSLLGFTDELGNATARMVGGETPGLSAKIVGNVVGAAPLDAVMALQFEAAQAVDYNRPLVNEHFFANLGTDMMIGGGVNFFAPILGAFGRSVLSTSQLRAATKEAAKLKKLKKHSESFNEPFGLGQAAPESITFGDELHTSIKESVHGWPAREVVAGKELEDAFKASALQSKVLSNLKPQKVMLTPENVPLVRKMMDDMVELDPSLLKDKQWVSAHRDLERIADLGQHGEIFGKGIDNLNLLDSTITGIGQKADLTAMALHTVPAFDIELVAARAGDQLRRSGVSQRVLGALQDVVKQTARESSEEKVKALLRFRNITREFGVTDFDTVTSILDPLLTDVSVFEAKAADRISLYIKGTDDLLAAQQSFEASFKTAFDSRVIDSATSLDSLRVGEMADASGNMKSAAIGLEEAGLIDMDQLRLLLQGAEGLEDVVISAHPGMKAAVAMNSVRAKGANKMLNLIPTGDPPKTQKQWTLSAIKWTSNYLSRIGKTIQSEFTKGGKAIRPFERNIVSGRDLSHLSRGEQVGRRVKDAASDVGANLDVGAKTGIWKYRSMRDFEQKNKEFKRQRALILSSTATPDVVRENAEALTNNITDPELQSQLQMHAIQRGAFLRSKLPQMPEGRLPYHDYQFSPAEVSNFLETAGVVEDPLSYVEAVLQGGIRDESLEAFATLYPQMLADVQVRISEQIMADPEKYGEMPYKVRLAIDHFLGGGYEPSGTDAALRILSNKGAQTELQQQAQHPEGTINQQKPAAFSPSDRLAGF